MSKIINSRKALYFSPLVVVIAFLTLSSAYVVLQSKASRVGGSSQIGSYQLGLFHVYEDAEELHFYIEQSAIYAARQAVYELGQNGGSSQPSECGDISGYPLWNTQDKECYPDYEQEFITLFKANFNRYLENYPVEIPSLDYDVTLEAGNQLIIKGIAGKSIVIDISEPDEMTSAPRSGMGGSEMAGITGRYIDENSLYPCPVEAQYITAGYHSKLYRQEFFRVHNGVDFGGCAGNEIRSIDEGTARFYTSSACGNGVFIQHSNGVSSVYYCHLKDEGFSVRNSVMVGAGEVIGYVGATGAGITGPHLHFEIKVSNQYVDPLDYVDCNIPCSPGWCEKEEGEEQPEIPEIPEPEVPEPPGPITELKPNQYASNNDLGIVIDYNIQEYSQLVSMAKEISSECPNDMAGTLECIRKHVRDVEGITITVGECDSTGEPSQTQTEYRFCAVSRTHLSVYSERDTAVKKRNIRYRFALTVEDKVPPPKVTGLKLIMTDSRGFAASWDRSQASDIDRYRVYVSDDPDERGEQFTETEETSASGIEVEEYDTKYYITVIPADINGNVGEPVKETIESGPRGLIP